MNTRQFFFAITVMFLLALAGLNKAIQPVQATSLISITQESWTDLFDSPVLDSRWSWVRENPLYWSLTDNPGYLRLMTSGSLHQTGNNLENILLTSVSSEDFRLITEVSFNPTENYQAAGLLVYHDDDNYIEVTRVYADGGYVRIKRETDGVSESHYSDALSATTLYLRLDKFGDDYYGFYSLDGNIWEFIAQFHMSLTTSSAGLAASNGPTIAQIPADFNFFQFIPLSYSHSWKDGYTHDILNSAWSWINEDLTHWSLTASPGFLQILTQAGSLFSEDFHNLLVTEPISEDYQITTKVTFLPVEPFQSASIVVYGDANNYVSVARRYSNTGDEINFRQMSNGVLIANIPVSETAATISLRIIKEDSVYSGYYSTDDINYTYIGHSSAEITDAKVGLISENGPSTNEIIAEYDFFEIKFNAFSTYLPLNVKD